MLVSMEKALNHIKWPLMHSWAGEEDNAKLTTCLELCSVEIDKHKNMYSTTDQNKDAD